MAVEKRKESEHQSSMKAKRAEVQKWMHESIRAKQLTDKNSQLERENEKARVKRGKESFDLLNQQNRVKKFTANQAYTDDLKIQVDEKVRNQFNSETKMTEHESKYLSKEIKTAIESYQ